MIAQDAETLGFFRHLALCDRASFAQTDNARYIQRARPHASLVTTAIDLRSNLHAWALAPNIQGAHTLRSIYLVAAHRHQIDVVLNDVNGRLANCLNTVGVEQDAAFFAELANLANGLQDSDLVVREHDADEN